jgi:Mrp family chromosome partitioning ATPase
VDERDPRRYLRVARRQAWVVVLALVVAIGAAWFAGRLSDPVYRASAKIVVGQGGGVFQPEFGSAVTPFTQTMTNLLQSHIVARRAIERGHLDRTTKELLDDVHVAIRPESSVLDVTVDAGSRGEALRVLSAVTAAFSELVRARLGTRAGAERPVTATVFDPPHLEAEPVSPRPARNELLAGALGLALGLVLAFARESMDTRIRSRREAERAFHAPVVAALPRTLPAGPLGDRPRARRRGPLVEALGLLRASIQVSPLGIGGPVTLLTSAAEDDGKTPVAASLAVALARAEQEVVVVEADLRRPLLARALGLESGGPGLAEVLAGAVTLDEVLADVDVHRSWLGQETPARSPGRVRVLPAGSGRAQAAELLVGDRAEELVADLRAYARFVLIDGPPLLGVGDAYSLARAADGVVVVARVGATTRDEAEAVHRTLRLLGIDRVAVVLTGAGRDLGGAAGVAAPGPVQVLRS